MFLWQVQSHLMSSWLFFYSARKTRLGRTSQLSLASELLPAVPTHWKNITAKTCWPTSATMTEGESTRPLFLPKSKLKLRRSRKAWPSRRQSLRRGPRTPGTPTRTRPILTEDSHPAASTAIRLRHEVPHPHRRVHQPQPRILTGLRHTQVRYVLLMGFFDDRTAACVYDQ